MTIWVGDSIENYKYGTKFTWYRTIKRIYKKSIERYTSHLI